MQTVLLVLLAFFSIASFFLAVVTISNAFRLRNVLLTWREGRLKGFPLFATIFLGMTGFLFLTAWAVGETGFYPVIGCYAIMAMNWVISSYYMSKRYITDHGIVKNINDPSQTVAWKDIHDFIEQKKNNRFSYAFLYMTKDKATNILNSYRLELDVPVNRQHSFRKLLNHKLGRRFQHTNTGETSFKRIDTDN